MGEKQKQGGTGGPDGSVDRDNFQIKDKLQFSRWKMEQRAQMELLAFVRRCAEKFSKKISDKNQVVKSTSKWISRESRI